MMKERLDALDAVMEAAASAARDWAARRGAFDVDEKAAGDFVSDADLDMERRLRASLTAAFGDEPVIGEELGGALSPDLTGWAIDPIDGTSNFLLGLPLWGVSVGYLDQGRPVMGAIALPDLETRVSGGPGAGLRLNGAPHAVQAPEVKAMAIGENGWEASEITDRRAAGFRAQGFAVPRYRCASFSLASAALGRLSGYVEHGCGLWDLAAGAAICAAAGLAVETRPLAPGHYAVDARWPG